MIIWHLLPRVGLLFKSCKVEWKQSEQELELSEHYMAEVSSKADYCHYVFKIEIRETCLKCELHIYFSS